MRQRAKAKLDWFRLPCSALLGGRTAESRRQTPLAVAARRRRAFPARLLVKRPVSEQLRHDRFRRTLCADSDQRLCLAGFDTFAASHTAIAMIHVGRVGEFVPCVACGGTDTATDTAFWEDLDLRLTTIRLGIVAPRTASGSPSGTPWCGSRDHRGPRSVGYE